jgi:hypothetical protein
MALDHQTTEFEHANHRYEKKNSIQEYEAQLDLKNQLSEGAAPVKYRTRLLQNYCQNPKYQKLAS